jgi:phosphatidylserine/phosphatidylglycerophosphate/cardiolipin synthase-like enzyme
MPPIPTLAQLRTKWFLDFSLPASTFPPIARHAGTAVSDYTDGNLVTLLIDGQNYMRVWHDGVRALIGQANTEVYHAAWRLEAIRTLGQSVPTSDALDTLDAVDAGGVKVYALLSMHVTCLPFNVPTNEWLRLHGIWTSCLDQRYAERGSNHQKAVCIKNPAGSMAILGSIDISKTRWDRDTHLPTDTERDPRFGKPTHDTGVKIQGPAVADIEHSFRERWNDPTRTIGMLPLLPPQPVITTPVSTSPPVGTHSVQVLHTYGIPKALPAYSWSRKGEFTVWASYLKALRTATTYIYIEDQYFLPFDYPPCHTRTGFAQSSDLIFQLGEAIKRGVKVAVLVPSNAEDSLHVYQQYQRDLGANYLATVAATAPGDFVIASLSVGTTPVYVHSKLMICDDEFIAIGSANVGQRSMTLDGELHIGIVDSANTLAREFRKALWSEHLGRPPGTLDDPDAGYALFKADVAASSGRVRPYSTAAPGPRPTGHPRLIRLVIDPYGGPPR